MPAQGKTSLLRCALPPLLSMLLAVSPLLADDPAAQAAQQPPAAPPATSAPAAQPAVAAPISQPPAQTPANPPPAAAGSMAIVQGLKVIPLAGRNEVNDIERKVMAPLVVQVVDQNDRPVESAEVVFRFPLEGPSATFPGGKTSQTARTNSQGQAAAMNWMANDQSGHFEVHVNASYGNQVGELTVPMSNATKVARSNTSVAGASEKRWFAPTWVKIALVGGAVAIVAGVVLATRGGGSKASSTSTVTISPGSPSIGGPH